MTSIAVAKVDFARRLQPWDGFGVTYVEAAQTYDYDAWPQDYGSLSILAEADRQRVLDLVWGDDGLRPGITKMFMDVWHAPEPGQYDHDRSTNWMRYFVTGGMERLRQRGEDLEVIVTLYGPPAWATVQNEVRGRDLREDRRDDVAAYLADWARQLRETHGIPVTAVSLHNEAEDWDRWDEQGHTTWKGHDYNIYLPPETVADLVKRTRKALDAAGLKDVRVSPGETSNWVRFDRWGYADAIADDPEAVQSLGLVTSHGFMGGKPGLDRWFGDARSAGIDKLRAHKPDLKAWVTSQSWWKMEPAFIDSYMQQIYGAGVNALIPWACIQRHSQWVGGDPNPGTALLVTDEGELKVMPGYWYFRQLSRAGRRGTHVCHNTCNYRQISIAAFASDNYRAMAIVNSQDEPRSFTLEILGSKTGRFDRTFSTGEGSEAGDPVQLDGNRATLTLPASSVTTLVEA